MPNKSSPHGGKIVEGSISTGTLRTDDLLNAFASELERLVPFNSRKLVADAREAMGKDDEEASEIVNELQDELNTIAHREGFYFGNLEGDGADFGFWRVDDEQE